MASHLMMGYKRPDVKTRVTKMDRQTQIEIEAEAFRRLKSHLAKRSDVQNIDLMNLAGFCRNCLSRWYQESANSRGIEMDKEAAREEFYGMPYSEWRDKYQTEATDSQKTQFEAANREHGGNSS